MKLDRNDYLMNGVDNEKYWAFIASGQDNALYDLKRAFDHLGYDRTLSLVDVGSGPGNILLMADVLYRATRPNLTEGHLELLGIEHDKELVIIGNRQLRSGHVEHKDAFDHDYKNHDIIYYYCPIKDGELMCKLERKMEDEAKVGAVIIAQMKKDERIRKDTRFKRLGTRYTDIWLKIKEPRKKKV